MVSEVIWSSHWPRTYKFALQEAELEKKCDWRRQAGSPRVLWHSKPVCASSQHSWARGSWKALTGAPVPVPEHGFLPYTLSVDVQPQISLKFTELGSLVSSPGIWGPKCSKQPWVWEKGVRCVFTSGDVRVVTDPGWLMHINVQESWGEGRRQGLLGWWRLMGFNFEPGE